MTVFCINKTKHMLGISGNYNLSFVLQGHVDFIGILSVCITTLASRGRPLCVSQA